ncbi:coiled-coil domain-containing protein 97-like [Lytechinus variegatus]|uniref:coiled-coil domain-containing protein 97-like n=1 Tax=Lytechinus variegatus TaxID=7654 RepID=UPI001BB1F6CB|nr:coiled-coil domain-containing protein 97-like [Lytechinus variegatus]
MMMQSTVDLPRLNTESIQAPENMELISAPQIDTTDELLNAQRRMFENIALSNARIKNLQRDDVDLSMSERVKILSEQFHHSPAVFIEKFHPYLCEDDLVCFEPSSDVYEVSFYLKRTKRRLSTGNNSVVVKNRRYEALKKLEKEGTYFSDDEMRAREPLMYEQLIGQYLTDEERAETRTKVDKTDLKFSTILMSFMQDQETKELYKRQQDKEEEAEEEEDDDDDDDEIDGDKKGQSTTLAQPSRNSVRKEDDEEEEEEDDEMMDDEDQDGAVLSPRQPTPATEAEKHLLREEFQNLMRERFLSGGDQDFDYAAVDNNEEYDSLAIRAWDEEEKYFDDDDATDADEGHRIEEQGNSGRSDRFASRTDNEELDDYEKWTPEESSME